MTGEIEAKFRFEDSEGCEVQTTRLGPIRTDVCPEQQELARNMRVIFSRVGKSVRGFAAVSHFSSSMISRYLSGERIPEKSFLDCLLRTACSEIGMLLAPEVENELYRLHLEALRSANPSRFRVQVATDTLEQALIEKEQVEESIGELRARLSDRERRMRALELGSRFTVDFSRQHAELDAEVQRLRSRLTDTQKEYEASERRCRELEAQICRMEVHLELGRAGESNSRKEVPDITDQYLQELAYVHGEANRFRNSAVKDSAALRRLRDTAIDVARKRLPDFVRSLNEHELVTSAVPMRNEWSKEEGEISEVAQAFEEVHYTAISLVNRQANNRDALGSVINRMSQRVQACAGQQLALLSDLRSKGKDSNQDKILTQIEFLAAVARRKCESLLLLAGERIVRRYEHSKWLKEILRTASCEVNDASRIEFGSSVDVKITSGAGRDLVHMLAELLDNALRFSPPKCTVQVDCAKWSDEWVLIRIDDEGVGINPQEVDKFNESLSAPFDPYHLVQVSPLLGRAGFAVVGALAEEHGIHVKIYRRDQNGLSVLVLLPASVWIS